MLLMRRTADEFDPFKIQLYLNKYKFASQTLRIYCLLACEPILPLFALQQSSPCVPQQPLFSHLFNWSVLIGKFGPLSSQRLCQNANSGLDEEGGNSVWQQNVTHQTGRIHRQLERKPPPPLGHLRQNFNLTGFQIVTDYY